jgi:hypothetical protein
MSEYTLPHSLLGKHQRSFTLSIWIHYRTSVITSIANLGGKLA